MLSDAVAKSSADAPSAADTRRLTYRPYLDGLRAVAVYLVVAFHSNLGLFSGGFIGVDVFFVLSGFLVTRLLLRDIAVFERVRLDVFYSRRARRILPAAIVTLAVTAIAYSVVASPAELLDVIGGFRAAFLYVANWFFIHQANNYFVRNITTSPVLHFWSLAIEEQFYLLWPVLLTVLYLATERAGRRRWWVMRAVVVTVGLLSALQALRLASGNVDRAYYGTDTRAYQLLAGALLAMTPQLSRLPSAIRRRAGATAVASLALVVLLGTSAINVGPISRGVIVALLVFVLIAALENAPTGAAPRILSTPSLTYLGRISYGTYLWHWPLVVLILHGRDVTPVLLFLIVCPTATLLAAVSFKVMEQPIRVARSLNRYKTRVIAAGAAASLIGGLVLVPLILDPNGSTLVAGAASPTAKYHLRDWRAALKDASNVPDCLGQPVDNCIVARGTGPRVMLVGDSNAQMWLPAFEKMAKDQGWTLGMAIGDSCAWQRGVVFTYVLQHEPFPFCAQHQNDWYARQIPQFDPDIVVFAERPYDDPRDRLGIRMPNGYNAAFGDPRLEPLLIDATNASIAAVRKPGRKIVVLEPIPHPVNFEPLDCLSTGAQPEKCGYQASTTPTPLEAGLRAAARAPDVWSIDLDRVVCPRLPTCDAIVDDVIVSRLDGHITGTFALSATDQFETIFRRDGITSH